jgi:hypothetical protein
MGNRGYPLTQMARRDSDAMIDSDAQNIAICREDAKTLTN